MFHIYDLKSLAHLRIALWLLLLSLIPSVPVLADQVKANQAYKEDAAGTIHVAFSPNGGATKLVTDTIHQAKKQMSIQRLHTTLQADTCSTWSNGSTRSTTISTQVPPICSGPFTPSLN